MNRFANALLKMMPTAARHAVIRNGFSIDDESIRSLSVHVANTPEQHEKAARLLQGMYERRGIVDPHPSGLRVQPQHLAPSTVTFVARDMARPDAPVVGAMSLVLESPLGLPMDSLYGEELKPLRAEGRRLAEVGALCLEPGYRGTGAMYLLCRIMNDYAMRAGCDDLVIAVHPDVADYYFANMLFQPLGPVRTYPGLRKTALSQALRLDLRTFLGECTRRFGMKTLDSSNPLWLWFGRENPQIESFDFSEVGLRRHLRQRRKIVAHLAALRPDALEALEGKGADYLADVVPELRAPLEMLGRVTAQPVERRRRMSSMTQI